MNNIGKLFTSLYGVVFLFLGTSALASPSYNDVLVVVNDYDPSTVVVDNVTKRVSVAVGEYFRAQRNMPAQNLCHVNVDSSEYPNSGMYTYQAIKTGVINCLAQTGVDRRPLSDSINYIVLTKGMPIKYDDVLGKVRSIGNSLYVDLTGVQGSGESSVHPYYAQREQFTKAKFNIFLVTYLIGYDYAQTIALIDRAAIGFGSTGKLVLDRGVYWDDYTKPWFVDARTAIEARGFQGGVYDWDPANDSSPKTYITDVSDIMMYHSSGSNDDLCVAPNLYHLGFVPGAIGDTYVSTSGRTFKYDVSGGLSKFVDNTWTSYGKATELDLPYHFMGPIAFDGSIIWVGTAPQFRGPDVTKPDSTNTDGIYLFDDAMTAAPREHYTAANSGLVNNKVNDIVVDGNWVWIATASGLSRYNKTTEAWDDVSAFALAGKDIRDIEIDAANNELWVAHDSGVKRFDRTTGALSNTFTTGNGLYSNDAKSLAMDTNAMDTNAVWIATAGGLNRWDRATGSLSGYTTTDGLRDNNVKIVRAGQTKVWVGYAGASNGNYYGVSALDKSDDTWVHYSYDPANPSTSPLENYAPRDILIEPGDVRVWVATPNHVAVLTTSTSLWTDYNTYDKKMGVAQDLAFDGSSVWISATRSGQSLIADLVHEGITGVQGYVAEPYVTAISLPKLLYSRYTDGFNLAESFYMASNEMRWRNIVVGDPKVAPFAPRVTTFTPVNGSSAVGVSAPVSVSFASPGMGPLADMDWMSINANTVTVTAGGVGETLSFTSDRSTQGVKFNPTGFLKGGTTYTVTLKGGVSGIHNVAGAGIFEPTNGIYANDITWTFTTEADADNDGLSDAQEATYGTNVNGEDTDGDGVKDGTEVYFDTSPTDFSSKPDLAADTDGDGLSNADELAHRTNPIKADSDDDGVNDAVELYFGYAPDSTASKPYLTDLAALNADSDGDELTDFAEIMTYSTNPQLSDTDNDGLKDGWEVTNRFNPLSTDGTDSTADADGDGVNNYLEYYRETDPRNNASFPTFSTIYVDGAGAGCDAGGTPDGTQANPYCTIDDGVAAAQGGDTVQIAGGTYTSNVPSTSISVPIILTAAPGQQVIYSGLYAFSSFTLSSVEWGKVSGIRFTFGTGVLLTHARNVIFENNVITGATPNALTINQLSKVTARNLVVAGNTAVTGIQMDGAGTVVNLSNVTVTGNGVGINFGAKLPTVTVKNAIVYGNTTDFGARVTPSIVSYSLVGNAAFVGSNGNIMADPLFVAPANGDYRLQSRSPAVDAGNPADNYSAEPAPNGCRINMGMQGGTDLATVSLTDRCGATIWMDDALPTGATTMDKWTNSWVSAPIPFSGSLVYQGSTGAGTHGDVFETMSAPLQLAIGESLFAYVYLNPNDMPNQVMLSWHDAGGNWEHRAYWGQNKISAGVDGTASRLYMGPLPSGGGWVRLEVPASAVGLEGRTVVGMGFTLHGGNAYWDYIGKFPSTDNVWVEDALPTGATTMDKWTNSWVSTAPIPFSGSLAYQGSTGAGTHGDVFETMSAPLQVAIGESLFAYVYLNPNNMPNQVMLSWHDAGGNWEHRAYWGQNKISAGVDGTASRLYMGPLPSGGGWVRLEVPASAVGLEGRTVVGMGFTLHGGNAYWDYIGKSRRNAPPPPIPSNLWLDDALPEGATGGGSWTWVSQNPAPYSGVVAYQTPNATGTHGSYFDDGSRTWTFGANEGMFVYVYLDPVNTPEEVMVSFRDIGTGGNWEHRAYWGANKINYGTDGTASRRYMGALPTVGGWVRLEIPASVIGLGGRTISGMGFTLFGGSATWDFAGKY